MLSSAGIVCCALVCAAQPPTAFEAVSIHRNLGGSNGTEVNMTRGRLVATNASLLTLIRHGYDIQNYQLANGPSWLDSDGYDIAATTGNGEETTIDQNRSLMRALLAERFHLRAHWETRQASIYVLVAAKKGHTMHEAAPSETPGVITNRVAHDGRIVGTNVPMSYLCNRLSNQLSHPVIDKTGLSGKYDWTLVWDPDPGAESTTPSLFTAVQEQLGLKLDPQKARSRHSSSTASCGHRKTDRPKRVQPLAGRRPSCPSVGRGSAGQGSLGRCRASCRRCAG